MRSVRRACGISVATTALVLAGTGVPAHAAVTMTLSNPAGPSGGGNTVIGTVVNSAVNPSVFPAGATPTVQFQYAACSTMAKTITQIAVTGTATTAGAVTVDPADVTRITSTKIAFKVPSGEFPSGNGLNTGGLALTGGQITAKWYVCVYDSDSTTSSTLLASSSYTIVPRPTITSITPDSSPAGGGQTITVNGVGFGSGSVTAITASIGGTALTNVKVAANGNSFTATTAPRGGATGLPLSVTTPGGTVSSLDPNNDGSGVDAIPFSYSNGITIAPNTAAAGSTVTVDVTGAGFSQLLFDTTPGTPTNSHAHVFLVRGAYNSATNRGVAECGKVTAVSDTELVCTLDLSADALSPTTSAPLVGTPIPEDAYILTVVADGSTGAGSTANPTIVSSGSAFVVGPY
ncbi:IPT/TIG domain-containing protein [Actinoplanes sp. HUAS TT8]|uniref:IPT/TIG domain-containing protein n=1 Tax=Actinoplanes sp. HUAS TT8 TaxID=3447453 RepID=UPI003F520E1D